MIHHHDLGGLRGRGARRCDRCRRGRSRAHRLVGPGRSAERERRECERSTPPTVGAGGEPTGSVVCPPPAGDGDPEGWRGSPPPGPRQAPLPRLRRCFRQRGKREHFETASSSSARASDLDFPGKLELCRRRLLDSGRIRSSVATNSWSSLSTPVDRRILARVTRPVRSTQMATSAVLNIQVDPAVRLDRLLDTRR